VAQSLQRHDTEPGPSAEGSAEDTIVLRHSHRLVVAAVCGLLLAPAPALADNVITLYGGLFVPKGEASRVDGDALVANLGPHLFDISDDFRGGTFGGEWHVGLGDYLEVGAGVGFYQRTAPSIYRELVDADGSEIEQDFQLRIVPVTFTARVFPTGRTSRIQPYIGGGLGIAAWRYSETGEFVDEADNIFRASYRDEGNALGPVVLGGVRIPATTNVLIGGEFRYFGADADLDLEQEFLGDRIDLGHYSWLLTVQIGF